MLHRGMRTKLRKRGKANHLAGFATHRVDNVHEHAHPRRSELESSLNMRLRFAYITANVSIRSVLDQGFIVEEITVRGVVAESAQIMPQWMLNHRIGNHRAFVLVVTQLA